MKMVKRYIDLEPKWVDITPQFIEWLEDKHADAKQKELAKSEIMKMAKLSDAVRQTQKKCDRQKKQFHMGCK
jgi:hypothetical protein